MMLCTHFSLEELVASEVATRRGPTTRLPTILYLLSALQLLRERDAVLAL